MSLREAQDDLRQLKRNEKLSLSPSKSESDGFSLGYSLNRPSPILRELPILPLPTCSAPHPGDCGPIGLIQIHPHQPGAV
jgi:hypothetical protein